MLEIDKTDTGRILVIDDDHLVREISVRMLLRAGFRVDAAEDAETGWEALAAKSYELLITDYDMPGMSGLDLIKKLRASGLKLPVILISGRFPLDVPALAREIQPGAVLPKPFSYEKLLATVAHECLARSLED